VSDADTRSELAALIERSPGSETLFGLAAESREASELLEQLAHAVFPPDKRDLRHLTWPEVSHQTGGPKDPVHAAEERLRAAEARFKSLVEQIPAVTFLAALGEGENEVYVSPHIEAMLGFTQQEWLENPFLWYWQLHPDDRALWNDEFTRGCSRGGPFQAECRFLAKDGHVVWVHGEARILKDADGRPQFLQGIAFDITESKRAQEVLMDRAVQDARMAKELDIARRVQTSILPRVLEVPGLELAAVMLTAAEVGGDYYDVYRRTDGAWIAIADVSGHGLQAGIVMLMAQTALSTLTLTLPDAGPSLLLSRLNQLLYDNIRVRLGHDDHVTFSLLRYHSSGEIHFAGAHEIFLLWRARSGRVEVVNTPGTWLGAVPDINTSLPESRLLLEPGDVFLLYTDGVTEAMNGLREQFGLERLTKVLADAAHEPTDSIVRRIVDEVRAFMVEQEDDISIVVMRQLGGKGSVT
jgi:PAS domain S-box-containing protein